MNEDLLYWLMAAIYKVTGGAPIELTGDDLDKGLNLKANPTDPAGGDGDVWLVVRVENDDEIETNEVIVKFEDRETGEVLELNQEF